MARTVWCVFQRLPTESCPLLSAVCASREVADALVRVSEKEEQEQGRPPSAWTISRWDVLEGGVEEIEEIQQISGVLDPMRDGVSVPSGEDAGETEP
jgi:hypothetical protein